MSGYNSLVVVHADEIRIIYSGDSAVVEAGGIAYACNLAKVTVSSGGMCYRRPEAEVTASLGSTVLPW